MKLSILKPINEMLPASAAATTATNPSTAFQDTVGIQDAGPAERKPRDPTLMLSR
jgi:hypothetical protein